MKISFCTVCKGRLHHLRETLPRNIAMAEGFDDVEFLILDYNSQDGMEEWARRELAPHVASGRLTYYHEKTALYHSSGHSKNVLFNFAANGIVVNVDADNFFAAGYIQSVIDAHKANPMIFMTGPQVIVKGAPKDGTYGRISIPIGLFHELRGYDEEFYGWGAEEWDLMNRARATGYSQVKIPMASIGTALDNTDEERYLKNYDPSRERLLSNQANIRIAKERPPGAVINPRGYGKATVYRNFSQDAIAAGAEAYRGKPVMSVLKSRAWGRSGAKPPMILATILDYTERPGILMSKAWIVRAKRFCPDWDIVVLHARDIPEIMEFAGRFDRISFERMDLASNEIRKELCGRFGTISQNYKIPFLRHVHDAKWPPFVFVDADAMILGDISSLGAAVNDKPFVATTECWLPWSPGHRVVNTGVFAYRPESGLLSYERLHSEWIRCGKILKFPTGEQGLIIPMLHREKYEWEHPAIGPEYNVMAHASVLDGNVVRIAKEPPPGTPDWITWWVGWGCEKEAKIVHAISKWKWWNFAHLNELWSVLVQEVYDAEK